MFYDPQLLLIAAYFVIIHQELVTDPSQNSNFALLHKTPSFLLYSKSALILFVKGDNLLNSLAANEDLGFEEAGPTSASI